MTHLKTIAPVLALLALTTGVAAQKNRSETPVPQDQAYVTSSAAFAEVKLRLAEIGAEVEAMLGDYTENHPDVIRARVILASLEADAQRLRAVKPDQAAKLSPNLGKMIVKKADLLADYRAMEAQYPADNPMVKRAKKRFEVFAEAIDDILGN